MADILMPQLGESVVEGFVANWLKQVGDQVALHEPLLEIETDKINTEIVAPAAGILAEIVVPAGQRVSVGTVVGRIATAGTQPAAPAEPAVSASAASAGAVPTLPTLAEGEQSAALSQPSRRVAGVGPISPVVAKLAAEYQLDLRQIQGTGLAGRVSKQDVLRFLAGRADARDLVGRVPNGLGAQQSEEHVADGGAITQSLVEAAAPTTDPELGAVPLPPESAAAPPAALTIGEELRPLSPMRRAIAEHLTQSVRTAPHVTTVFEVDFGQIAGHREQQRAEYERQGVRLTFMPYVMQAVSHGLRAVPVLNGRYTKAGMILNASIHIGVAVALDEGLLVPVVRDVEEKSLLGLARGISVLAERARARKLTADELRGGTFSITNHGVTGSLFGTPIINQPQSGILGVGAIVRRPVVLTQHGIEAIAIRPMCYLSLTFDHRVCDGADADRFMVAVKSRLEHWGEGASD